MKALLNSPETLVSVVTYAIRNKCCTPALFAAIVANLKGGVSTKYLYGMLDDTGYWNGFNVPTTEIEAMRMVKECADNWEG